VDARIERLQRLSASSPGTIALGGGLPAEELFPRAQIVTAFLEAIRAPACPALQYGWPEGDLKLREWIGARLRARGARVTPEDVIVTSGAQQAISIAAEILVRPGGRVGVDRLTYPAALELFRSRRAVPVTNGSGVACTYCMPGVANPRGDALTATRRKLLLATRRPIIADEAYTELRFDGSVERPLLADAPDRVWHVGTLSKTLCPGFRVGWLVPPPRARARALRLKHDRDLQAGSFSQHVVRAFLDRDDFDRRLARARAFYQRRAERLLRAMHVRFPGWRWREPAGGFSVFVETDLEGDEAQLLAIATEHGVSFDPGRLFRPSEEASPVAMRLCFSAAPLKMLDEAVLRLERAVRAFESRRARAERSPSPARGTRTALAGGVRR
jgi:2-aminoadipate transaminase